MMRLHEWHSGRHMVGNRHFRGALRPLARDQNMVGCFGDTHGPWWRREGGARLGVAAGEHRQPLPQRARHRPLQGRWPPTPCGTPCPSPGPPATPRATRHARSPTSFAREHPREYFADRENWRTNTCLSGRAVPSSAFGIVIRYPRLFGITKGITKSPLILSRKSPSCNQQRGCDYKRIIVLSQIDILQGCKSYNATENCAIRA